MNYTPEVEEIEPIKQIVERSDSPVTQRLRVAAYARVSTEQDEQQNSYEAQVQYYTEYIKANPLWEFIGVFSDAGITGTNTKNRDGFNQMVDLALDGGIDLILTKSISRFARNTVDTLSTVRQLKEAGVEVIFEKENLRTFDPKCEVMLTIMSSLAQEESRSISENVRWGQQKSMKDGKVHIAYSAFLGYRKGPDKILDLGGKTLTVSGERTGNIFTINDGVTFTIKNGTIDNKLGNSTANVMGGGNLVLDGVTIKGTGPVVLTEAKDKASEIVINANRGA